MSLITTQDILDAAEVIREHTNRNPRMPTPNPVIIRGKWALPYLPGSNTGPCMCPMTMVIIAQDIKERYYYLSGKIHHLARVKYGEAYVAGFIYGVDKSDKEPLAPGFFTQMQSIWLLSAPDWLMGFWDGSMIANDLWGSYDSTRIS